MSASGELQIHTLLQQTLAHLQRNDFQEAERLLDFTLAREENNCDTLHLYGQMRRVQNRFAEAEVFYRKALAAGPGRAELHYHLGQLLVLMDRLDEALPSFHEAIRLKPNFFHAYLDLGLALSRKEDYAAAEKAYRQVLRLQPNLLAAKQALSATLIILGRAKEAETVARTGLMQAQKDPQAFTILEHNLAIAISEQRRYAEALAVFDDLQARAPGLPRAAYNRANTLQSMGRFAESESSYREALARDPLDMKAHTSLTQLLYRLGREDFLSSYDVAMGARPDSAQLPTEKARFLFLSDRYEEAREAYERSLAVVQDNPGARDGLGSTLTRLGRYTEAAREFERVLEILPDHVEARCNFAECLSRSGDPERALAVAQEALRRQPYNQTALALWGTALRQTGDEREHALNDYEQLVRVFDLEAPRGFSDMASFNRELAAELALLHLDSREHINQTSRLGTKTSGSLFGAGHELVEQLKERIDAAVGDYIAGMKSDVEHPLFRRRGDGFQYWGSWSTRLNDCGYHTNHVHPRGWISSAYYVALPDAVADERETQGWIKFGEPSFDAGFKDPIRRVVQPAPGRLVLFPSYMWHGTVPFRSAQPRVTLAFDAVPSQTAV
ncbi:MAG TPA: tetratricopeptide repeat protein [Rhizomicrobium sp.]|nr:tetratricopeptide repeat protein [Rhizomicrobium sp.]